MAKIYYIEAAELPFFLRVAHLSLDGDTSNVGTLSHELLDACYRNITHENHATLSRRSRRLLILLP